MWLLLLGVAGAALWLATRTEGRSSFSLLERSSSFFEGNARPEDDTPICRLSAADVADRTGAELRSWVLCTGRRDSEVRELAGHLANRMNDSDGAAAVLQLWNARRRIETSPPDGQLSPERLREATSAHDASDEQARTPAFDPVPLPGFEAPAPSSPAPSSPAPTNTASGYNAQLARQLAGPLSRHIRSAGLSYSRERVRAFQRAAGIGADGLYGCLTKNALRHFGVSNAPNALAGASRDCATQPYTPPPSR